MPGGSSTNQLDQAPSSSSQGWFGWLWGGTDNKPLEEIHRDKKSNDNARVANNARGAPPTANGNAASDSKPSQAQGRSTTGNTAAGGSSNSRSSVTQAGNYRRSLTGAAGGGVRGSANWDGLSGSSGSDACHLVADAGWLLLEQVRESIFVMLQSSGVH